jgi:hypothetical protein
MIAGATILSPMAIVSKLHAQKEEEVKESKDSFQGDPIRIREIKGFENLLTKKAKRIYNTKQYNTIIEVNEPTISGNRKDYIRGIRACHYFSKPAFMEHGKVPQWAIKKLANTFNTLVKENMVDYGVLAPAMWLELQQLEGEGRRALLVLYTFGSTKVCNMAKFRGRNQDPLKFDRIDEERLILNEFLDNEAFAFEGELGSKDWNTLPG